MLKLNSMRLFFYRNFVSKLWNVGVFLHIILLHAISDITHNLYFPNLAKYIQHVQGDSSVSTFDPSTAGNLPLGERYFISRIHEVARVCTDALANHRYSEASTVIYEFLWDEFADWYIEVRFVSIC